MNKTFLQHLQEAVGANYPAEDIFANLDPDEIIQEAENYALSKFSVVGQREQLVCDHPNECWKFDESGVDMYCAECAKNK